MRKFSFMSGLTLSLLLFLFSCEEEPTQFKTGADCEGCNDAFDKLPLTFGQPPVIKSFSPQTGFEGTRVLIQGSNFSANTTDNLVAFDGVPATVLSATTAKLLVIVPAGTTTGRITIKVSGFRGESASDFRVVNIPLNGLAAFYPFDGDARDASANENHGVVIGATPAADRNGDTQHAFYLDGNDYLNMGNPPSLQISNEITFSFWANLPQTGGMVFNKKIADNSSYGYMFDYATNSIRTYGGFRILPNTPGHLNYYSFTVPLSQWTSFTITVSGSQSKYYMNGALIATHLNQCPLVSGSDGNLLIGNAQHLGWGYLVGHVDDFAIYNRALTDSEVLALHQQTIIP
jgi:hypothetical protein